MTRRPAFTFGGRATCFQSLLAYACCCILNCACSSDLEPPPEICPENGIPGLDPVFGDCGVAESSFEGDHGAGEVVLGENGSILVTAWHGYTDFGVARYTTDGMPDSSFGSSGETVISFDTPTEQSRKPAITLADGKILVVGETEADGEEKPVLFCLDADGDLDSSFGDSGSTTFTPPGPRLNINDALLLPNGRTLLVGDTWVDERYRWETMLVRLDADGYLDQEFGDQGIVLNDSTSGGNRGMLQADGNIIIASGAFHADGDSQREFALLRYDSDGHLDQEFGTDGIATMSSEHAGSLHSVSQQEDGKLLSVGSYYSSEWDETSSSIVIRFTSGGDPDTTFGDNGVLVIDVEKDYHSADFVTLDTNERILVVGNSGEYDTTHQDGWIARIQDDGTLDPTFGDGGKILVSHHSEFTAINDAAIQEDDKLVIVGQLGHGPDGATMLVARYVH